MKNSVKATLVVLFLAVTTGLSLTLCSHPEKPGTDGQDTVKIDTVQNPVDSAAQDTAAQDSSSVK